MGCIKCFVARSNLIYIHIYLTTEKVSCLYERNFMSSFVLSFKQTWLHTIINNDLKLDAILLFLLFYPSPVSFRFLLMLLAVYVRTTHFLTFFRSYFCPFILCFFHPWLCILVGLVVSFTNSCRFVTYFLYMYSIYMKYNRIWQR